MVSQFEFTFRSFPDLRLWRHEGGRVSVVARRHRIAAFYAIEVDSKYLPASERAARRAEIIPLMNEFFAWAEAVVRKLLVKSTCRPQS
jgi:hypothetical protein